jgi:hypothetical protein
LRTVWGIWSIWPPTLFAASTTTTSSWMSKHSIAALTPAAPAPITTTSWTAVVRTSTDYGHGQHQSPRLWSPDRKKISPFLLLAIPQAIQQKNNVQTLEPAVSSVYQRFTIVVSIYWCSSGLKHRRHTDDIGSYRRPPIARAPLGLNKTGGSDDRRRRSSQEPGDRATDHGALRPHWGWPVPRAISDFYTEAQFRGTELHRHCDPFAAAPLVTAGRAGRLFSKRTWSLTSGFALGRGAGDVWSPDLPPSQA